MFSRLKEKWGVNWLQFTLIFTTFALGGSTCGYLGRKLLGLLELERGALYFALYLVLVTLLWPLCVLVVSIPFGQFPFFKNYLVRMARRMGQKKKPLKLAVFASGTGSNAEVLIKYFAQHAQAKVALIVCNNPQARVLAKAEKLGVPTLLIEKGRFFQGDGYIPELRAAGIDFVVLAGFLWKIPPALVATYPQKMVNIHPALLPKFGGKGMYGANVHAAVLAAGETETGITIHYVNEHYDEGGTIFQARCPIVAGETPESLAAKVHALEHAHLAKVVEGVIKNVVR